MMMMMIIMNTNNNYNKLTFPLDLSLTSLLTKAELEQKLDSKLKENEENLAEQEKVAEEFREAVANDSPYVADSANEVLDWAEFIQEQQDEIIALAELIGNSLFFTCMFPFFLSSIRIGFVIAFLVYVYIFLLSVYW